MVLSRPGKGRKNTHATFCYPAELLHAAVDDLLEQGVDWVLVPQVREYGIPEQHLHAYACSFSEDSGGVIQTFFAGQREKIYTPEIGFSAHLLSASRMEIIRMAKSLGVSRETAEHAFEAALNHQAAFEKAYHAEGQSVLNTLEGPLVILLGRPYAAYNGAVNLSIPRKIASRGSMSSPPTCCRSSRRRLNGCLAFYTGCHFRHRVCAPAGRCLHLHPVLFFLQSRCRNLPSHPAGIGRPAVLLPRNRLSHC